MPETRMLEKDERDAALPRSSRLGSWFIPPVVIPAIGVLLIAAMAISRALI